MLIQDLYLLLMQSWCLNVLRDPARPAGEETQNVQCQEGPQALAAPLHPGQQPLPSGHQEALPASDKRGPPERKPPPEEQGGEQKSSLGQGGRGSCQQINMNVTTMKEVCLGFGKILQVFVLSEPIREVCIRSNECTYKDLCHKLQSKSHVFWNIIVEIFFFFFIQLPRMCNLQRQGGMDDIIAVFINEFVVCFCLLCNKQPVE